MTELAGQLTERPVPGAVPRWEVPGWGERFGVTAGMTGRGVSAGIQGFDLGLWGPGQDAAGWARWEAFLAAADGFDGAVLARQVHGREILIHHEEVPCGLQLFDGADGHVSRLRGVLLLVTVADCVPVYLIDPVTRTLGLVHAGWRGFSTGVLESAIDAFHEVGAGSQANLVMHCGISISGQRYEVGNEVLTACGKPPDPNGRGFLDLRMALAERARVLGIGEVTVSTRCTAGEPEHFFSHRGSGGSAGRQVAYLGWPRPKDVLAMDPLDPEEE